MVYVDPRGSRGSRHCSGIVLRPIPRERQLHPLAHKHRRVCGDSHAVGGQLNRHPQRARVVHRKDEPGIAVRRFSIILLADTPSCERSCTHFCHNRDLARRHIVEVSVYTRVEIAIERGALREKQ